MIRALLRHNETLMVFAANAEDDYVGPYQELAPKLLERPDDTVIWLVEDPTGSIIFTVPAEFIRALVDGDAERSAALLKQAVRVAIERQSATTSTAYEHRIDLLHGWVCMVCGADRTFYQISVAHRIRDVQGQEVPVNVRYCNDNEACTATAAAPGPWRPIAH